MNEELSRRDRLLVLWERILIVLGAIVYLSAFSRTVPHGDALRVVRQIQTEQLSWNPNHLMFDPIGYGWYMLLKTTGFNVSALASFEIISVISTIASLIIFHAILVQLGVKSWGMRITLVVGLFASRSFLSLANSQYYFMVQMPFLLGGLYLFIRFLAVEKDSRQGNRYLYGAGILAAIAGTILFSNVLLVVVLGLVAGLARSWGQPGLPKWHPADVARVWGAAALVGFPIYIFGYAVSDSASGFFSWLLSYQGESGSVQTDLYRVQLSLHGVAESIARLGFNLLLANILENAGLGSYLQALVFREPLEFIPETGRFVLVMVLTPIIIVMMLFLIVQSLQRLRQDVRVLLAIGWTSSFLLFNFFWSVGNDLFWVQVAPIVWLMLAVFLVSGKNSPGQSASAAWHPSDWKNVVMVLAVPALLIVNTMNTIIPVSGNYDDEAAVYHAILRDGDLEIMPGWEAAGWLRTDRQGPVVERLLLYNMAMNSNDRNAHIGRLPDIVEKHLASGHRVVVGRLYDKDHLINPWYRLKRLGWSRSRIQSLLSGYCHPKIGMVGDVVFREIRKCQR